MLLITIMEDNYLMDLNFLSLDENSIDLIEFFLKLTNAFLPSTRPQISQLFSEKKCPQ